MKNDRIALLVIMFISVVVLVLIGVLMYIPKSVNHLDLKFLPFLNAIINSGVSVFLLLGLFFIYRKDVRKHRLSMLSALSLSVLFLVIYTIYHSLSSETRYCGVGWSRTIYFTLLLSHITLAVPVMPLALLSVYQAIRGNILIHKRLVKWAYPIWLYVSITGPIIYWMLSPCYH